MNVIHIQTEICISVVYTNNQSLKSKLDCGIIILIKNNIHGMNKKMGILEYIQFSKHMGTW